MSGTSSAVSEPVCGQALVGLDIDVNHQNKRGCTVRSIPRVCSAASTDVEHASCGSKTERIRDESSQLWSMRALTRAAAVGREQALHHAAMRNEVGCIKVLLAAGANANLTSADGSTALHEAGMEGHIDSVETLVSNAEIGLSSLPFSPHASPMWAAASWCRHGNAKAELAVSVRVAVAGAVTGAEAVAVVGGDGARGGWRRPEHLRHARAERVRGGQSLRARAVCDGAVGEDGQAGREARRPSSAQVAAGARRGVRARV
eukprot:3933227-Rhodomonas_salina.3